MNKIIKKIKDALFNNKLAVKYGSVTTIAVIIALVLLMGINWLATLVSDRLPIDIDMTAAKENSISADNRDIIENIKADVTVTVCASKEGYQGEKMAYYTQQINGASDDTVGFKYFAQTIKLLDEYQNYNSKIKVVYNDPQDTSFSSVVKKYPNQNFNYGDILVEAKTKDKNGEPLETHKILTFADIYNAEDLTGYAQYGGTLSITGNNIETALTSAIYAVSSSKRTTLGYLSGHCDINLFTNIESKLKLNNYEVTEIGDVIISKIPDNIDVVAICAPKSDFSADEIQALDDFLDNGGKRGKGLVFFAGLTSPDLPNLYAFLEEWGIVYDNSSKIFETNEENMLGGSPSVLGIANSQSDYTANINDSQVFYVCGENMYMVPGFETKGTRTATEIASMSATAVVVPANADDTFDTSGLPTERTLAAILTEDKTFDKNNNELISYVAAFSSADFISDTWSEYAVVGNNDMVIDVFNAVADRSEEEVYFSPKAITNESFAEKVTNSKVKLMKWLLIGLMPAAVAGIGIFTVVRRKRR